MSTLTLSEEQIRWFRARRGHLAGPGAATPADAARDLLGAQAQVVGPALHALSLRTRGRPTAEAVTAARFEPPRSLVRTWGPRETVHLYAIDDWAAVVAARAEWSRKGRKGSLASDEMLDVALAAARATDGPVTRPDMEPVASDAFVESLTEIAAGARQPPRYFAAGRLIFGLSARGDVCTGAKRGSVQTYPLRERWFPDLAWDLQPSLRANAGLTRRYLGLFGPATVQDVAHYFGAKVSTARRWMAELAPELMDARCGDLTLRARRADEADLRAPIPPDPSPRWPVRLLPKFDTLLMGHADKRWTVPVAAERKAVWRPAAQVSATVLRRGVVVATWNHKARKRWVGVTVTPLSGWDAALLPQVQREADALAAHLGRSEARVEVA